MSTWDFERIASFRLCGYEKKALIASPQIFGRIFPMGSIQRGKWVRALPKALKEIGLKVDLSTREPESLIDYAKKQAKSLLYNINPSLILKIQNWLYMNTHNK